MGGSWNPVRLRVGAAAMVLVLAGSARAADDGFATFWKSFAAAVAKDDKAVLATMVGPNLTPFADFHATYLKPSVRRCLATGKPVRQVDSGLGPNYHVTCAGTAYVFLQVGGAWELNDLELDD